MCEAFWNQVVGSPLTAGLEEEELSHAIPVSTWGDESSFYSTYNPQKFAVVSVASLLSRVRGIARLLLVTVLPLAWMAGEKTIQSCLEVVAWSLSAARTGRWPSEDCDAQAFANSLSLPPSKRTDRLETEGGVAVAGVI